MATVAVCVAKWLNYSETFIYRQTMALKAFDTVVLSLQTPRLRLFPHPRVHSLNLPNPGLLCGKRNVPRLLPRPDLTLLARMARREDVALLHAHYGTVGRYYLDVARRLRRPLGVTFHGTDAWRNVRHPGCLARYREMWAEAGFIVAVSERMKKHLISAGCPEEKVHCVYTGVPASDMPYSDPRPASKDRPAYILCVGRLAEVKGHRFLIEAVAQLRSLGWDARLRLIGGGPLANPLRRLADRLGMREAVAFEGPQPQSYVQQALRQAHAFALASFTPPDGREEALPVALKEAMAAGAPCVATRHGGIPELVKDGVSGILVQPADPDALAAGLLKVLQTPGLARHIARAARQRIEDRFDVSIEARQIESLYSAVLGPRPRR